jgi:hypothetical protein
MNAVGVSAKTRYTANMLTEDQAYAMIRHAVENAGGQRAFARNHNLSVSYVSDLVKRRRGIGAAISKALGIEKVVLWKQI